MRCQQKMVQKSLHQKQKDNHKDVYPELFYLIRMSCPMKVVIINITDTIKLQNVLSEVLQAEALECILCEDKLIN